MKDVRETWEPGDRSWGQSQGTGLGTGQLEATALSGKSRAVGGRLRAEGAPTTRDSFGPLSLEGLYVLFQAHVKETDVSLCGLISRRTAPLPQAGDDLEISTTRVQPHLFTTHQHVPRTHACTCASRTHTQNIPIYTHNICTCGHTYIHNTYTHAHEYTITTHAHIPLM